MHPRFLHRPAIRRGQQEQANLKIDKQLWLILQLTCLFMFTASGSSPASGLGHVTQTTAQTDRQRLAPVGLSRRGEWQDIIISLWIK